MSVRNINDRIFGPIIVTSAGNTIHVGTSGSILQDDTREDLVEGAITEGKDLNPAIHDNTYIVDGQLFDDISGIYAVGDRDRVNIGETGRIHAGSYGAWLRGNDNVLDNQGEISAGGTGYGVYVSEGSGTRVGNGGTITGDVAIGFYADSGTIVNERNGIIVGDRAAVEVLNSSAESVRVANHGLISCRGGVAVLFAGLHGSLLNDGTIRGNIYFGDGGTAFDNRGGVVKGSIFGGAGDDTLTTDNAKYRLTETGGHGVDTVKSTVSYTLDINVERLLLLGTSDIAGQGTDEDNLLRGNGGKNFLNGLGGADTLIGGKGDDVLLGGGGADIFGFATGSGKDTITDFHPGEGDVADLHGWTAIRNMTQLLHHASNHGPDVWISAGSDTLIFEHLHKADLAQLGSEFLF